nr:hypothetical protein [Arenimonas metalli]
MTAGATPASVAGGGIATFTATVDNDGPNEAIAPSVGLVFDALVSMTASEPVGWSCVAGSLGNGNFNTVCTATGSLASGARVNFTLNVTAPNVQGQPTLTYRATVGSTTPRDPLPVNNSATRTLQVEGAPAAIPGQSGRG